VIELARCFTGWTIRNPRTKPEFAFDDRVHDPQPKRVSNKNIHAGGVRDGEQALDLLARDPHTAHHIALELAQHFVSDTPPGVLVDRMAVAFRKSGGDLRETMHAMIYSPEFWSRAAYRAKIKTPFELVVSAARALGADVDTALPLVNWVTRIGEPLYQCLPPTGYSDKASAWVNAGALLNRLNFALAGRQPRRWQPGADRAPARQRSRNRSLSGARTRCKFVPGRPSLCQHALDTRAAISRSANCAN
jgi:uncharacterized protein (DUF1800 family)